MEAYEYILSLVIGDIAEYLKASDCYFDVGNYEIVVINDYTKEVIH